jgi:succinoglycan biosynthesis transport protein ExoP
MLKEIQRSRARIIRSAGDDEFGEVLRIPPRFSSIIRHKRLILRVTACFVFLAVLFAMFRHDSYTAATKLLIDNKSIQLGRQDAVFARSEVDVPLIQNQIELLRSETIANQVIDTFDLVDDPDFGARHGFLGRLLRSSENPEEDSRRLALESFKRRLYVGRMGDSYTLEIRFTAATPERAAKIANEIGADFINFLAETNAKVAQSASSWLRSRLKDMGPNASVIAVATPPLQKDGPNSLVVVFAAILAGLTFGTTSAFAADVMDRSVRTPYQASAVTRAECFGIVPLMENRNLIFGAVRRPRSYLTHTIRRVIAAIREQSDVRILGVISTLPGEGKTLMAANVAQFAAASGSRVLLIDAAMYSSKLSRLLAPDAQAGLGDVLKKAASLSNVLCSVSDANLKFLPIGERHTSGLGHPGGLSEIHETLAHAAALFNLIVVDLPPVIPLADVREAVSGFDAFLLIVEWGKTSLDVLHAALADNDQIRQKLLGVVLNKVDLRTLRTYDKSLSSLYNPREYYAYVNNSEETKRSSWFSLALPWFSFIRVGKRAKQQ